MLHARLRAAAGRDRIPTDGLIAWYTMDNISGSTLVDEQGSYNGTISGATQTAGIIGQALSFDGVNDYVNASFGLQTNVFTWAFWFNTSSTQVDFIVDQNDDNGSQRGVVFGSTGFTLVSRDSGYGYHQISNIGGFQDGNWHLCIASQNETLLELLIDDTAYGSYTMPSVLSPSAWLSSGGLGRRRVNASAYYTGLIDQFRQYNRSLTSEEKTALYNEGA